MQRKINGYGRTSPNLIKPETGHLSSPISHLTSHLFVHPSISHLQKTPFTPPFQKILSHIIHESISSRPKHDSLWRLTSSLPSVVGGRIRSCKTQPRKVSRQTSRGPDSIRPGGGVVRVGRLEVASHRRTSATVAVHDQPSIITINPPRAPDPKNAPPQHPRHRRHGQTRRRHRPPSRRPQTRRRAARRARLRAHAQPCLGRGKETPRRCQAPLRRRRGGESRAGQGGLDGRGRYPRHLRADMERDEGGGVLGGVCRAGVSGVGEEG